MREAIRVTHVAFDLEGGGMESLVAELARRFAGTPIVMSVITLSGRVGRVGEIIRRRVDQFHVARQTPGLSMLAPLGLAGAIRSTRPHIVHLHSGSWYKGSLAARMARVETVIYTEHGREHDDPPITRWLDRRAEARTDVVVPVSERLARYLTAVLGVRPGKIRVIVNGVDLEHFTPGQPRPGLRAQLNIPDDAWVLGSVGRLEPVKAYHRLIHVVSRLRGTGLGRPVYLVLCGKGSEWERLTAQARDAGVAQLVRMPGWSDTPVDMYRLLDVFALTSVSEGASLSLMEAMACGTAPVVMDVGANAEIVGPDLGGQVVPAGDAEGFVRAVQRTLATRVRLGELGRRARQRVIECYGFDRMALEYEQLYRVVFEAHRARPSDPERPGGRGRYRVSVGPPSPRSMTR